MEEVEGRAYGSAYARRLGIVERLPLIPWVMRLPSVLVLSVLVLMSGCKKPTPSLVDVRRTCQTSCAAELRTADERAVCRDQVTACERACEELLQDEGLPCVECLEASGVDGPIASEDANGALVCEPGVVSRGSCTHICPVIL